MCGGSFDTDPAADRKVFVAHACVCAHVHTIARACRVCRPDDAGHDDPSGEEAAGLHPRVDPHRGDVRG